MPTEYELEYLKALEHQIEHEGGGTGAMVRLTADLYGKPQPWQMCLECLHEGAYPRGDTPEGQRLDKAFQRRYSWAIPDDHAIEAIKRYSPAGVVDIGAGAGYWCYELQKAGVDAIAYDPDPPPTDDPDVFWHMNVPWTAVHRRDHTVAADHPDRALLIVWPSLGGTWATEAVETYYKGDTVILVGEGMGGCTGEDRLFAVLGDEVYCWHGEGETCDCVKVEDPQWRFETAIHIPQWFGLHDYMAVYKRVEAGRT